MANFHPKHPPHKGPKPQGCVPKRIRAHKSHHSSHSADNLPCHFASAFGAGFCATLVVFPVDGVKMRYMNTVLGQHSGSGGSCALTLLRNEGPEAFYKGRVGVCHPFPSSSETQSLVAWRHHHSGMGCADPDPNPDCSGRFVPSFLRLGSWKFMIFITYEQLKQDLMATRGWREVPS